MSDTNDTLKKRMIAALESTLGVVASACKRTGISRQTHYRWLKEDPAYKEEVDSIGDLSLDFAESQLHSLIASGNVVAVLFYLKTKGKKRGYIERHEVDHSGEMTSNTIIKWGDKEIKI